MIKLDIKDYCHSCPGFEASVNKIETDHVVSAGHDTIIRCKFKGRCESMVRYLKKVAEDTIKDGLVD